MGKRSSFERRTRDFYPTPYEAVVPLLPHLPKRTRFHEPCCGDLALVRHLERHRHHCSYHSDIKSGSDALLIIAIRGSMFITNPPWPHPGKGGEPTISIALHLSSIAPTWLLLSADFAHNVYFTRIADRCVKIVSVGRVKWIPDSKMTGKDNAAWYLFDKCHVGATAFIGRAA